MKTIAIIPARGGSKGIPGKNIIDFCGKPLIAWSIRQALNSQKVDSVWVTSDSDAILEQAEKHGARGIKRPDDISGDTATSESAWIHAVNVIHAQGMKFDCLLAMQATSPLREPRDIAEALSLFQEGGYDSLFSGCKFEDHFMWKKDGASMASINYDYNNRKRRQNLEPTFLENGSFYICRPEKLLSTNNRLHGKIGCFVMEAYKAFQLDSPEDLALCRVVMQGYGLDKL